jgi:hypothetical protein
MSSVKPYLLVSGLPGAGKTKFSTWLAKEHGYVQFETDANPGVGPDQIVEMKSQHERLVVDWPYPPEPNLERFVKGLLIPAGFDHWWFDGSLSGTFEAYRRRYPDDEWPDAKSRWLTQTARISASWDRIAEVYEGKIIVTVSESMEFLRPAEIYEKMRDATPGE